MLVDRLQVARVVPGLSYLLARALTTSAASSSARFQPRSRYPSPSPPSDRSPRPPRSRQGEDDRQPRDRYPFDSSRVDSRSPRPLTRRSVPLSTQPTSKRLANRDLEPRRDRDSRRDRGREQPPHTPITQRSPFTPSSTTSDNHIRTTQPSDPSVQPRQFSSYPLHPGLVAGVTESVAPTDPNGALTTPIQSLSLANLLGRADTTTPFRYLLGAETGSGKTLAYLLPLLHHLKATDTYSPTVETNADLDPDVLYPRALVLSPTHELTRQSTAVAKRLSHSAKLSVLGLSSAKEAVTRTGNVDVLFGTGGSMCRVMGLKRGKEVDDADVKRGDWAGLKVTKPPMEEPLVGADRVEWVVIDEADVLLGPDFADETLRLLSHLASSQPSLNLILVTATLPPSLLHTITTRPFLSNPPITQLLSPGLHRLPPKLETRWIKFSGSGNRLADLAHEVKRVFAEDAAEARKTETLENGFKDGAQVGQVDTVNTLSRAVVFCNSESKVAMLSQTLESKSLPVLAWTSESAARTRGSHSALSPFLRSPSLSTSAARPTTPASSSNTKINSSARVLVTTSLLSRGLDFAPSVSTVFLLDPPRDVLDFVHRAGRAGRAGRPGRVVVFGVEKGGGSGKLSGLRQVVGKSTNRASVKPGGRTWSGRSPTRR